MTLEQFIKILSELPVDPSTPVFVSEPNFSQENVFLNIEEPIINIVKDVPFEEFENASNYPEIKNAIIIGFVPKVDL